MLADVLSHAGAVMIPRAGRFVAAHYGSASGEESVCRKHVGLAVRSDLDVLELAGRSDQLDLALARLLGSSGLLPSHAVRSGHVWCARADPGRALIVGPPAPVAGFRRLAAQSAIPVVCTDRSGHTTVISLLGPRLRPLLMRAELPCHSVPATVRVSWWRRAPIVTLQERADRYTLFVAAADAADAWHALVDAGRPLELSCVGLEALERLAAVPA